MKNAVLLLTFILLTISAFADVNESLKNMENRLPEIIALKKDKAIGENNNGYLALLKETPKAQALVQAENNDRKIIYASLAEKHGISTEQIGKQRALQIHQIAIKGTMLQDGSGKWYEK